MRYSAPGVVKLFGEHAVVYRKLAVGAAVPFYAHADVTTSNEPEPMLAVKLSDLHQTISFNETDLVEIHSLYSNKKDYGSFVDALAPRYGNDLVGYGVIAARLHAEGINVLGKEVTISADEQLKSGGLGSGAACSVAFTVALIGRTGRLDDEKAIDIAREGDRTRNKRPDTGAIDASTSYRGGIVTYKEGLGSHREEFGWPTHLVLIDTGPKTGTSAVLGNVQKIDQTEREVIMRRIEQECAIPGFKALRDGDHWKVGELMSNDHSLLRDMLGVSSDKLDAAVVAALQAGALGAKMSGGGRGGYAVAVSDTPMELGQALRERGFNVKTVEVAARGAKASLRSVSRA